MFLKNRRIWLSAAVLLAVIWFAVGLVMQQTNRLVSWPAKVIGLMEEAPWLNGEKSSPSSRQTYLNELILNILRLDFSQRRRMREDGQEQMDKFLESLTEPEQKEYVDRTVQPHIDFVSEGLKRMTEDERKRFTTRLRGELRTAMAAMPEGGEEVSAEDRKFAADLIADDISAYLQKASVKTKLRLAPMIEGAHMRVQFIR